MKNQKSVVKDHHLPVVVLTADTLINLIERVNKLEEIVKKNHDSLSSEVQENVEALWRDCIPEITKDGRLKFKAYNETADPVDALVVASIVPRNEEAK